MFLEHVKATFFNNEYNYIYKYWAFSNIKAPIHFMCSAQRRNYNQNKHFSGAVTVNLTKSTLAGLSAVCEITSQIFDHQSLGSSSASLFAQSLIQEGFWIFLALEKTNKTYRVKSFYCIILFQEFKSHLRTSVSYCTIVF